MQKSLEILSNAFRECCRFFCEFRLDARDLRLSDEAAQEANNHDQMS